MEGKTCLITGGSDGIGYAAAREFARMGATVAVVGRNPAKTAAAAARIVEETGNPSVRHLLADLSSQGDVRRLAAQVKEDTPRLDVLVNTAGAVFLSNQHSVDGIGMPFALNHLGSYQLTTLLLALLQDSAPARIVNVTAKSH
ncbi:MAG: SDR family NAD(P)-dependent oxidoreductase, partial [Dehalococcoidia bacterium]|nr:SDR family NAD(P)-dependent oxidoreductase [Dehalococcoidia bacterium]